MERQTFLLLLDKYLSGSASLTEQSLLEEYYKRLAKKSIPELSDEDEKVLQEAILENIQLRIQREDKVVPITRRSNRSLWYAAAASVLLFLTVGTYFFLHKKPVQQTAQNKIHDIAPGGNKAILTLADGKKIILSDAQNGIIAQQGASTIKKNSAGEILYTVNKPGAENSQSPIQYNTITTPRGGEYRIKLPDGSEVWLNAGSSLKYPSNFTGKERKVELTGEGYFEVVHNAKMPFTVASNGQTVQVLGTHFNINAYKDEPAIRTTLLEGSVKVNYRPSSSLDKTVGVARLKPGQQASVIPGDHKISVMNNANTDEAIAWHNGLFIFNDESLESIMRKVSRWYNIDVQYRGKITDISLLGVVSRTKNISAVLHALEATGGVHFKIEPGRVIVMP
jgi:transmembrane sensor